MIGRTMETDRRFVHEAFFYASDDEYLKGLLPFISAGIEAHEPVAIAVPGAKLRLLDEALDVSAEWVTMVDMTQIGRNPGRIIPRVLRAFADSHHNTHVRIIGEPIWPGRTSTEYPACVQHEALINAAFAGRDVTIVCPYDSAGLDTKSLVDAEATHPLLRTSGGSSTSDRYAPNDVIFRYNERLVGNHAAAAYTVTTAADLSNARRFAVDEALRLGLAKHRLTDLMLITTELITNSLIHTRDGICHLQIWCEGDELICATSDSGYLTDALAGRRPAGPGQSDSRGLLLINDLADLVRIHSGPDGTTIHAHLQLQPPGV